MSPNLDPNRGHPPLYLVTDLDTGTLSIEERFRQDTWHEKKNEVIERRIECRRVSNGQEPEMVQTRVVVVEQIWRRSLTRFWVIRYRADRVRPLSWHALLLLTCALFAAAVLVWPLAALEVISEFNVGAIMALLTTLFGLGTSKLLAHSPEPIKGQAFEELEMVIETTPWEKLAVAESPGNWMPVSQSDEAAE